MNEAQRKKGHAEWRRAWNAYNRATGAIYDNILSRGTSDLGELEDRLALVRSQMIDRTCDQFEGAVRQARERADRRSRLMLVREGCP
jgi:hypothetical protein